MSDSDRERRAEPLGLVPALLKGLRFVLAAASALMVCFMMFLTFADVLGRYVFSAPIRGA